MTCPYPETSGGPASPPQAAGAKVARHPQASRRARKAEPTPPGLALAPGVSLRNAPHVGGTNLIVAHAYAGRHNAISYVQLQAGDVVRVAPVPAESRTAVLALCGGSVVETVGGQKFSRPAGSMAFAVGSSDVSFAADEPCWIATLRVDRAQLPLSDERLQRPGSDSGVWAGWHRDLLLNVAKTVPSSFAGAGGGLDPESVDHYLAATLELLLRSALDSEPSTRRVRPAPADRRLAAEQFIQENLLDADLSPAMVADSLSISRRQLARTFDQSPGVAATITQERLTRADRMLRDRSLARMTIGEIAEKCRFSSSARFSKAYKAHFGMTPSAARAADDHHSHIQFESPPGRPGPETHS